MAGEQQRVSETQNTVSGEVKLAPCSRLRNYRDEELEVNADLKEASQHAYAQWEVETEAIVGVSEF